VAAIPEKKIIVRIRWQSGINSSFAAATIGLPPHDVPAAT
jgi:hypothetical protein